MFTGCWIQGFVVSAVLWMVHCKGPPTVTSSYFAVGEIVNASDLNSAADSTVQIAFEETYDSDQQKAAFRAWIFGQNSTIVEDLKTKQTYQYAEESCQQMTLTAWMKLKTPPDLLTYEDTDGNVRFSLRQLFQLDNKYIIEDNVSDVFRGVPARKWRYEIWGKNPRNDIDESLEISAYWSDGSLKVPSKDGIMPLGYNITKVNFHKNQHPNTIYQQLINVYNFQTGVSDQNLLEPVQGIYCENRTSVLEFPNPNNIFALALHSELIVPEQLGIRYVDMWLDSANKILRMDTERIRGTVPQNGEKTPKYDSQHVIGPMGITFRITGYCGYCDHCEVIRNEDHKLGVQNLFNFKLPIKKWRISNLFGSDSTTYAYIGQTSKRDIPCHLFQGIRRDWPEASANVTSLWEWCFSLNVTKNDEKVKFKNGEYGLVNAQVKVIESPPGQKEFPQGLVFIHHFYDVSRKDPALMSATNFDISKCFAPHQMRGLQFVVDWEVFEGNLHLVEKATSDPVFLQRWKNMIYQYSGLQPYTLRVNNVKAVIEKDTLYIRFWLLNVHEKIPHDIAKNQKSALEAETEFRKNVNTGKVFISYAEDETKNMRPIYAKRHSVDLQVHRELKPHEFPNTTQPPTTTTKPFELLTESDRTEQTDSTTKYYSTTATKSEVVSKTPTKPPGEEQPFVGHLPGTVVGVSVGLLVLGISVGLAGTYFKHKHSIS